MWNQKPSARVKLIKVFENISYQSLHKPRLVSFFIDISILLYNSARGSVVDIATSLTKLSIVHTRNSLNKGPRGRHNECDYVSMSGSPKGSKLSVDDQN